MDDSPEPVLTVIPANEATREELAAVFGTTGYAHRCLCQRLKVEGCHWRDATQEERERRFGAQTNCGRPEATATSGLVAFLDGQPAGWVALEPRPAYPKLRSSRIPWAGRQEDPDDDTVWAVTCMVVAREHRGRGLTYALAEAAVDHARSRGATALEAYAMLTEPGKTITWGELNVGPRQAYEEAGLAQVTHPTKRRVVMRIDF